MIIIYWLSIIELEKEDFSSSCFTGKILLQFTLTCFPGKFADAIMGYWGLEKGMITVFTYDEKHFKRIEGLKVRKP